MTKTQPQLAESPGFESSTLGGFTTAVKVFVDGVVTDIFMALESACDRAVKPS